MKKYLILLSCLLFILGISTVALASNITIEGEIEVRGEYSTNTTDLSDDASDNAAFYDEGVKLSVDAEVTENTKAVIEITTEEDDPYGQVVDVNTWGVGTSGATNYSQGNLVGDTFSIRKAYISHHGSGLLGYNAGFKIGHMPLKLGNALFLNHTKFGDDALVLFADPTNELHVGLVHIKFAENTRLGTTMVGENDDVTVYTGLFNYKMNELNIGGDATYINDNTFGPKGLDFWNFGLRCDTEAAGVGIKADVEFQTGTADEAALGADDLDFEGWALLIGANVKAGNINVDAEFAYGSGDEDATDNKMETFVNSLGADEQHYTYVYEDRVVSAAGARSTGLANTWYIKVGADTNVNADMSLGADVYYLQAVEKLSDTYDEEDIGIEVDANLHYNIDKNLVYFVEAGILFADDLYKNFTGGEEPDDPYVLRHGVKLTF